MPRGEPAVHLTIRVPKPVYERVSELAGAMSLPVSVVVNDVLERWVHDRGPSVSLAHGLEPLGEESEGPCRHPVDAQRKVSWGVVCSLCRKKIR